MNRRLSLARSGVGAALAAAFVATASAAHAQPFEFAYGAAASVETGARRVSPVHLCPGGGFIAVGSSGTAPGTRVYVLRTRPNGAPIWEFLYDVAPTAAGDAGNSLVELRDGSGFVIAGSTTGGTTGLDVLLMKIDCNGKPRWTSEYHSPGAEVAFDVIEAASGDPAFHTQKGDLVVAGFATSPTGNASGLLLRTNAGGTLIWNRRYELAGTAGVFRALTEAAPSGGTSTGDIVAVGQLKSSAGQQALVSRVSGNTGLMGAAPHCTAMYGSGPSSPGRQDFQSVVELTAATGAKHLAMVGSTFSSPMADDLYLVLTDPNPCVPKIERQVGDAATAPFGEEIAFDVKELTTPTGIAPVGSLVLTGSAGKLGGASDAFLLAVDPVSLAPVAGSGRLYGSHGVGREVGHSLAVAPNGFIIAGSTTTDFQGIGDPGDLYLVGPDANGKTLCELAWFPPHAIVSFPPRILTPEPVSFLQQIAPPVNVVQQSTPFKHCP
jgi:hypothetical protein